MLTPVVADILAAPVPALSTDGKVHVAWELLLSNVVSTEITIDSVTAMAGDTAVQTLEGDALKGVMRPFGGAVGTTTLAPGQGALVFMDAVVDSYDDVPAAIDHAVAITLAEPSPPLLPATLTENVARFAPVDHEPIVIGPPLSGSGWLDGNSCCRAHRAPWGHQPDQRAAVGAGALRHRLRAARRDHQELHQRPARSDVELPL